MNNNNALDTNLIDFMSFDGPSIKTSTIPVTPTDGLTDEEKNILNTLTTAYSQFSQLPNHGPTEILDFTAAINNLQYIIGYRVARRIDPNIWS